MFSLVKFSIELPTTVKTCYAASESISGRDLAPSNNSHVLLKSFTIVSMYLSLGLSISDSEASSVYA